MRPESLFSFFAPISSLRGVGPQISKRINTLAGKNIIDLFWHFPNGLIDRRYNPKIAAAKTNVIATLTVIVDQHVPPPTRRLPYKIICFNMFR